MNKYNELARALRESGCTNVSRAFAGCEKAIAMGDDVDATVEQFKRSQPHWWEDAPRPSPMHQLRGIKSKGSYFESPLTGLRHYFISDSGPDREFARLAAMTREAPLPDTTTYTLDTEGRILIRTSEGALTVRVTDAPAFIAAVMRALRPPIRKPKRNQNDRYSSQ